ncbi:MAG: UDP-N-acetylmuramoyl-L-alanyl-D-glutamate--2,6-diaminopimelate ligase [Candidatus Aminicenantia bacterium]
MKIKDLLQKIDYISFNGNEETDLVGVSNFSKEVKENYIFVALKGLKFDGHDFIDEAISFGAKAVVSERKPKLSKNINWIRVKDARDALWRISTLINDNPGCKIRMIGVTGTNGKTTTTHIIESIFKTAGFTTGLIGTIYTRWGEKVIPADMTTPEAPWIDRTLKEMLEDGINVCVMEVSSHSLSMRRVDGIDFKYAVFTNLTHDHLDFHRDMESYFEAKKRLFNLLNKKESYGIINIDDEWGKKLSKEVNSANLFYGLSKEAHIFPLNFNLSQDGIEAEIATPSGVLEISSPLLGKPNLYNILASIGVATAAGISKEYIKKALREFKGVKGRYELVENSLGFKLMIDYAHSDDSLKKLLETVSELKPRRIIVVFGAGGDRDRKKRPKMGEVAGRLAHIPIITSDNPRTEDPISIIKEIELGMKKSGNKNYMIIPDRREAIFKAISIAEEDDFVVIAGKGHEEYQIVGKERIPFSDKKIAEIALEERSART